MRHTVFHIEDETGAFQSEVYNVITQAAHSGIQLTSLDFVNDDGVPTLDGMPAFQWLEAMEG